MVTNSIPPPETHANHRVEIVFLDRDGVINRKAPEGHYVTSWAEFEFLPGALEGLRTLSRLAKPVVVVTNQRGVARGQVCESDLESIHARMIERIRATGGRIDAVYHCPHEAGCDCRKPRTGLFERAANDLGVALSGSIIVGDRLSDMQAAQAIQAWGVLVPSDAYEPEAVALAAHVSQGLLEAAEWIVSEARAERT
jgi:histidinol-phosphate phosphatase family protein